MKAYDAPQLPVAEATVQIRLVFNSPESAIKYATELLLAVRDAMREHDEVLSPVHFCHLEETP